MTRSHCIWLFIAVAFVGLIPRLFLSWEEQRRTHDALQYERVAENILRGCGVSLSDPASAECVPQMGGTQWPGYPAFIALIWKLFERSDLAVVVAQNIVASLATAWLAVALAIFTGSKALSWIAGIMMAASPLHLEWSQYVLTETLTFAAVSLTFAGILRSLAAGRLLVFELAAALAFAGYVRLDGAFLAVPVALAAFLIHSPAAALKRGFALVLLLVAAFGPWALRNVAVGIGPIGRGETLSGESLGYVAWVKTWCLDEYARRDAVWSEVNRISIPATAYKSEQERATVERLLAELRLLPGGFTVSPAIDAQFAELASWRRAEFPLETVVMVPMWRLAYLWEKWINPLVHVGGAPAVAAAAERHGFAGSRAFAMKAPLSFLGVVFSDWRLVRLLLEDLWRTSLFVAFAATAILSTTPVLGAARGPIWAALAYIFAKCAFLSWFFLVEARFTSPFVPAMELSIALAAGEILRRYALRSSRANGFASTD